MPLPRSITNTPFADFDMKLVQGEWPKDISGELLLVAPGPTPPGMDSGLFGPGQVARAALKPGAFVAEADRFACRTNEIYTP